jgi:hypothetical protein
VDIFSVLIGGSLLIGKHTQIIGLLTQKRVTTGIHLWRHLIAQVYALITFLTVIIVTIYLSLLVSLVFFSSVLIVVLLIHIAVNIDICQGVLQILQIIVLVN